MLQAVIFDFDGVIADTEPLHFKAFNSVLGRYDINISREAYYREYLGYSDHDCFEIVKKTNPEKLGKTSVKSFFKLCNFILCRIFQVSYFFC